MLTLKIEDKNVSKREKDDNGFLIIKDNPIAKGGVFDYLLSEVENNVNADYDKIVKVFRPFDNLIKIKDSFANKPIKYDHFWVGEEDNKADGAIGSIITIDKENLMLRADLIIYNPDLIDAIEKGKNVELSPGYTAEIKKSNGIFNGTNYEYVQNIKCVNHLAVVEEGRSGPDLKIEDKIQKVKEFLSMKKSFKDSLLSKFKKMLDEDTTKENEDDKVDIADEDKRKIISEIMAIANKPADDFEGGEEEREKTIVELAEKLAYKPSEASKVDDESAEKVEDDDKETKDEEVVEKEKIDIDDLAGVISEVVEEVVEKKLESFEDRMFQKSKKISDTYNKIKDAVGYNFDYTGKNESELYQFGYENLTGKTLLKTLDAKTAFELALEQKTQKHFIMDSKISMNNKEKEIFDKLRKK
ncbi:DUF2213 domain-containing protein [Campylobacter sp.]|uniref:DUF2213 domain-containing protein n=1 Tax=Campylobacter sp. TaxID=205 RepID=UPI0025C6DBC0|nr:DUF2213 domain-containing protein [Campylobacter sp.]